MTIAPEHLDISHHKPRRHLILEHLKPTNEIVLSLPIERPLLIRDVEVQNIVRLTTKFGKSLIAKEPSGRRLSDKRHAIASQVAGKGKIEESWLDSDPEPVHACGSGREAWGTASDMQLYSGIAPVTGRSGNSTWVHRRHSRPLFIHQSFWEYAKQSCQHCDWAKLYVDTQIARGKKHSTAVRSLAFKWIRVMFVCWKQGTPYDDEKYLQALRQKKPPLAAAA